MQSLIEALSTDILDLLFGAKYPLLIEGAKNMGGMKHYFYIRSWLNSEIFFSFISCRVDGLRIERVLTDWRLYNLVGGVRRTISFGVSVREVVACRL